MLPCSKPAIDPLRPITPRYVNDCYAAITSTSRTTQTWDRGLPSRPLGRRYRLGAETGLRLFLGEHAFLTATGAADHLSEALRAAFRGGLWAPDEQSLLRGAGADPARVESDELTNYRANLRLTFTTRSHELVAFR
jgi:hypothetical protein